MEHHKSENLKLKLKLSKPLYYHPNQQKKLVLIDIKQDAKKQEQVFIQDKQDDILVVADDELEKEKIQDIVEDRIPEVEEEEVEHQGKDERKICSYCGKTFKHGKSLGGHLRIHGEKSTKSNPKTKGYGLRHRSSTCVGKELCPCEICGKIFPSKMSLYGHMRLHSNRSYRKMYPPPLPPPPPIGWQLKGRRGQLAYSSIEQAEMPSPLLSYCHLAEVSSSEMMMLVGGEEQVQVEVKSKFTSQEKDNVKRKGKRIEEYDDDDLYYLGISYPNTSSNNKNAIYSYLAAMRGNTSTPLKRSKKNLPTKKREMEYLEVEVNHPKRNNNLDIEVDRKCPFSICVESLDIHHDKLAIDPVAIQK